MKKKMTWDVGECEIQLKVNILKSSIYCKLDRQADRNTKTDKQTDRQTDR
jgi:hypothetical protein